MVHHGTHVLQISHFLVPLTSQRTCSAGLRTAISTSFHRCQKSPSTLWLQTTDWRYSYSQLITLFFKSNFKSSIRMCLGDNLHCKKALSTASQFRSASASGSGQCWSRDRLPSLAHQKTKDFCSQFGTTDHFVPHGSFAWVPSMTLPPATFRKGYPFPSRPSWNYRGMNCKSLMGNSTLQLQLTEFALLCSRS